MSRVGPSAPVALLLLPVAASVASPGTTRGDTPPQRLWMLGGPVSLRWYAPEVVTGRTFVSGRG